MRALGQQLERPSSADSKAVSTEMQQLSYSLELPLGGPTTIEDQTSQAFGFPVPGLSAEERRAFAVGNSFFRSNWVAAPASAAGRDGLGPLFNARSCGACHGLDGRGLLPGTGDTLDSLGLVLRLGVPGPAADLPEPIYGGQLQEHAIAGHQPEARWILHWTKQRGSYGDGSAFELQAPVFNLEHPAYGPFDENLRIGARLAPQLIGLGLLEAIPSTQLSAAEDPQDSNADGISGRVHWLPAGDGTLRAGRFGWKATQASVADQVAAAFVNDIGITSPLLAAETLSPWQLAHLEFASGGQPEIEPQSFERVVLYTRLLAVPNQRDRARAEVQRGALEFERLGCAICHTPVQRTDPEALPALLANGEFRPYTDLLLHDLGPGLADPKRDGNAEPAEWRTPPLWGLGLVPQVNGKRHLLHDGRARDFAEAILWHGGEAQQAREAFRLADGETRAALLAFLESL
jgi:CxxC motif-containing protein (DUF1111 family)